MACMTRKSSVLGVTSSYESYECMENALNDEASGDYCIQTTLQMIPSSRNCPEYNADEGSKED